MWFIRGSSDVHRWTVFLYISTDTFSEPISPGAATRSDHPASSRKATRANPELHRQRTRQSSERPAGRTGMCSWRAADRKPDTALSGPLSSRRPWWYAPGVAVRGQANCSASRRWPSRRPGRIAAAGPAAGRSAPWIESGDGLPSSSEGRHRRDTVPTYGRTASSRVGRLARQAPARALRPSVRATRDQPRIQRPHGRRPGIYERPQATRPNVHVPRWTSAAGVRTPETAPSPRFDVDRGVLQPPTNVAALFATGCRSTP